MKSLRYSLSVCLLLLSMTVAAVGQTVSRVEYCWDTDPGCGRGTPVVGWSQSSQVNITTTISTSGLSDGLHRLGLRARSGGSGLWSATSWSNVLVNADGVAQVEYFYDATPAFGEGIPLTAYSQSGVVQVDHASFSTAGLADGLHRLGIRARGISNGLWSPVYWSHVLVNASGVAQVEYFYDSAPAYGEGIPLTAFSEGGMVQVDHASLSATGVSNGLHRLGIRARGIGNGLWSPTYWCPVIVNGADVTLVEAVEYYWDEDPGFGNGTPMAFSNENPSVVNIEDIPVPTAYGEHTLCIRARAGAMWSPTYTRVYCIGPEPRFSLPDGDHVCPGDEITVLDETQGVSAQTYYWWDLQGDGEDDLTTQGGISFSLDQPGTYTLTLGVSNVTTCRNTYSQTVIVRSTQAPAISIGTDNTTVCEGTAARFVATTQEAEDYYPQYQWYRNGVLLPGLTDASVSIGNIQEGDIIQARVQVDNTCAPADSAWSNQLTMSVRSSQYGHVYVTHCGPYTWERDGRTYNKSGTKYYKGSTGEGCPIRDTLTLTVVDRWSSREQVTRCEPYTWDKTGQTYNKSGLKFYKGVAADGCPIRDTLELTIATGRHSHTFVTHCGPYNWATTGKTYNKSGDKYYKASDENDCPIRDTLSLTVVDRVSSHQYVTSCGVYTWEVDNRAYSQSGDKYHKGATPEGCPVYDTLTLTIVEKWSSHEYITSCGPYTWDADGRTYNKSGTKYSRGTDEDGCLIRDTLTLTVVDMMTSHEYVTNCGPYTWSANGQTYNKSGNKYYRGTTESGCPTRDTLTLTIVDRWSSHEYVTSCDGSYTWEVNGQTYNKSGTKYYKGTAEDGCPVRDTLTLTVGRARSSYEYVTHCGPYTWNANGQTYNKSGVKYYKSATAEGCPVRDTLNLTVVDKWSSHVYVTYCGPYTWEANGQTYNKSGTKYYKGTAADGCPTRDTLTLVINPNTTGDTVATATGRFTWYGMTFTSSVEVSRVTTNHYGCDSIVTLHLTINPSSGGASAYEAEITENSEIVEAPETWQGSLQNSNFEIHNLKVYPNPTTGIVHLDFDGNVDLNSTAASNFNFQLSIFNSKVEVLDLVGRRVAVYENTNAIDLSNLADGTYTLRITLPEGVTLRKVVKR